ncbi:flagellar basal body P-ring protein FlgI [Pirellulaceae bacterium SH467]
MTNSFIELVYRRETMHREERVIPIENTSRIRSSHLLFACRVVIGLAAGCWLGSFANMANAELKIQDICRLQGQEENTLQGIGWVVGLKGTGDGDFKPTVRSIAQALKGLGGNPSFDMQGRINEKEFANTKNVAMVWVVAKIPPTGLVQGDKVSCTVSAINAKSLEGGNLVLTHMLGPRADQTTTYALASGPVTLDDPKVPTSGRVVNGCKMEQTVQNPFVQDNKVTLVLTPNHSSFATSQLIADKINRYDEQGGTGNPNGSSGTRSTRSIQKIASAIDQTHVVVQVPEIYQNEPVEFVSMILNLPLINLANHKRVYINEREGVVVIGEDVTFAPVAVSFGNLTFSPRGNNPPAGGFVGLPKETPENPRLKSLVDGLNVLNVPTSDIITIIKGIYKQGNLYGELIIE